MSSGWRESLSRTFILNVPAWPSMVENTVIATATQPSQKNFHIAELYRAR
jgi:hypothetical protein